jgi:hypothetical protein
MTASDVPAERRLGSKEESNEEKTTARYVSWLVYFMNSEVPERRFAPLWHRYYRTSATSPPRWKRSEA